ncbi:hypothetical protein F66182_7285 [Fusarium sp. NRRL 66182]|nr:hypothetical protein F66182_7285 [Fusarium sp. NRRL 66182]
MSYTGTSPIKLILGTGNVGDSSIDPTVRYSTPDEVNAFFDVFSKRGYNHIDTARGYSPEAWGSSENRIGVVSAGDRFTIDSKADWSNGHTKESIMRDIDISRKRLKVEQINTYFLHVPDREHPREPMIEALDQACREGKIKSWSISNFRADEVQEAIDICQERGFVKPSVYQGQYNAIVRGGEKELFPLLRKHGIAFYAYSTAAAGFFGGSHKKAAPNSRFDPSHRMGTVYVSWYAKPTIEAAVDKALETASKYGIDGHAAALRWTAHHSILDKGRGDAIVIGASSTKQLEAGIDSIEEGPLPDHVAVAFGDVYKQVGDEIKYHL